MSQILIVDDDTDAAEATAQFLRHAGHTVRSAPNGREALAALTDALPDLAILDVRMPEMDGITFLEVMRCYLRWESVPVILMTAYPDDPRLSRARQLGVKRVFVKRDFRLDDLLTTVNEQIAATGSANPKSLKQHDAIH